MGLMKPLHAIACSLCLLGHSVKAEDAAPVQETGDLHIVFKYKGDPPKPKPLELPASCGSLKMTDETLIVSGNNGGIMNVVVCLRTKRGETLPVKTPRRSKNHTFACWNCRFVPRIVLAQTGDKLKMRNMDDIGYNVMFNFFKNDAQNVVMAPGRKREIELTEPEPTVIPTAATIFPWMVGYVLVADHPFYGASDPDGKLVIRNLPVGETLTFRAWHERGTFKQEIYVDGKRTRWPANRFSVEIHPGMNNMGVVELPPAAFE